MSVPAIALYSTPPSGLCQISSPEYEFNPRPSSTSSSPSTSGNKPAIVGGLSRLLSSSPSYRSGFAGCDELRHERSEDLGSSFSYSSIPSSFKCRDQSPVSVLHAPVSCSGSSGIAIGSAWSSRSLRNPREWNVGDMRAGRENLLNCFVRNALGSCLDRDLPSLPLTQGVSIDEESLTFDLEGSFPEVRPNCEPYASELLAWAQSRHWIFKEDFVVKAFYEAEKAHRGQMRASGDPYLQHCVETAVLLATIGANSTVVAAGLLHDTLDDSFMNYDYVLQKFGAGVADLVQGVSKLSQLSKLARESNTANRTAEADRLHTIFLAMADARAVLIKLADRLHNMMTLEALPTAKQHRFAKETLEIFAPLANRLGILSWKEQLENLCFKHLHPREHEYLCSKLLRCFDEAKITSSIQKLEQALKNEGLSYHVISGRHKSLYSIYSKMMKKKLTMEEIHDIHGIRLVVEKEEDCYKALKIVHDLWAKVVGSLKDYINHPKFNGYQSLHTVVLSEDELPLEVQIRTKEMHLQAEYGFAAHWRYKEGDCPHSSYVLQMVEWARWILTWQFETMNMEKHTLCLGDDDSIKPACPFPSHSDNCPFSYTCSHPCDHDGPIFVIVLENDKMTVQEFQPNSTITDLLERAGSGNPNWSPYSFPLKEELRPRLNRVPVDDPNQKLRMGDVIELTPALPYKSLTEYREEIQRMYDRGFTMSTPEGLRS
ncbi:hypothetical protein AXF42_Ash010232 [Apostasia shenzhenica]|uniref:GTP diphosphokinase n=1 Tax=Apostasia shenzhenica TaxID=1088818 RepID=A0A2I0A9Y0_9ASPA|nr:hypothetical protein AXF42_Ash010232 [Apostasia shenzhenica]